MSVFPSIFFPCAPLDFLTFNMNMAPASRIDHDMPSVAILMSGDPLHNATRCGSCVNALYAANPSAHPMNRAPYYRSIFRHLTTFAHASLFVFHTNMTAATEWHKFVVDELTTAVISSNCTLVVDQSSGQTLTYAGSQYGNLNCALLLMLAHEKAHVMRHRYVARMRPDYPVHFAREWFAADELLVLTTTAGVQRPLWELSHAECSRPGENIFTNDQFVLGHHDVMCKLWKAMNNGGKYEERRIFIRLSMLGASVTHVRPHHSLHSPNKLGDMDMRVNATGVFCRRYADDNKTLTWYRDCTFRPWDPFRAWKDPKKATASMPQCAEQNYSFKFSG